MCLSNIRLKRYKRRVALFCINHFFAGTRAIFFSTKRKLLNWAGIPVGDGTRIVGPLYCTCELKIGKDVWIGRNFSVDGNGSVIIGNCCDIAPNVQLYTGSHQIGERRRAGPGYNGVIKIGDGCWICAASKLLPNVTIGEATIVAAGSVVTKSFCENLMIGGVPAKTIKKL